MFGHQITGGKARSAESETDTRTPQSLDRGLEARCLVCERMGCCSVVFLFFFGVDVLFIGTRFSNLYTTVDMPA